MAIKRSFDWGVMFVFIEALALVFIFAMAGYAVGRSYEQKQLQPIIEAQSMQAAADKRQAYLDGLTDGAKSATLTAPDPAVARYCSLRDFILGQPGPAVNRFKPPGAQHVPHP
jgi:hypothetical protein